MALGGAARLGVKIRQSHKSDKDNHVESDPKRMWEARPVQVKVCRIRMPLGGHGRRQREKERVRRGAREERRGEWKTRGRRWKKMEKKREKI